jgi:2-dehydro-3-deoxygluconokinase
VLHLTGITMALSESGAATVHRALDVAREGGTLVSFDVNYRKALWSGEVAGAALRAIVPKTDILFAGMGEARLMTDAVHERDIARELASLGPRQVIIKRGPDGAFGLVDGAIIEAPLYRMPELDPVGAGDAFTAGYLAEVVSGADIEQTLQTAAQCGAFSVTVDGDWEGLPTRDDLGMLTAMGEVQR